MAEQVIESKRVSFPRNKQQEFLLQAQQELGLTWTEIAKRLHISTRSLTDWKNERISLPLSVVKKICGETGKKIPKNIEIKDRYWYVKKAAKKGGLRNFQLHGNRIGGDPERRKKKWREWWIRIGQFKKSGIYNTPLSFKKPQKGEKLAEFIGIMMGDGGLSKYQVFITLHHIDDYQYMRFVTALLVKLFGVKPALYHDEKDSVYSIVISRMNLVKFLYGHGLVAGNKIKQQIDVPKWIMKNKKYQRTCLRGLMDTDGCLVIHKYKVNGKEYSYKKINFCSASGPLVASVMSIFKRFDFKPRLSHNGRNVWIDNRHEVERYFEVIGSNNPKHHERFLR